MFAAVAAAVATAIAATAAAELFALPLALKLFAGDGGLEAVTVEEFTPGVGMFANTGEAPGESFPPKRLLTISPDNLRRYKRKYYVSYSSSVVRRTVNLPLGTVRNA